MRTFVGGRAHHVFDGRPHKGIWAWMLGKDARALVVDQPSKSEPISIDTLAVVLGGELTVQGEEAAGPGLFLRGARLAVHWTRPAHICRGVAGK